MPYRIRTIATLVLALGVLMLSALPEEASAQDFMAEFNRLCGYLNEADSLPSEEIKVLIEETEKLLEVIKASDSKRKKLYIFRLNKCLKFFQFVLDSRSSG